MKKLILSTIAAVLTVLGLGGIATMSPAYAIKCVDSTGAVIDASDISECYGQTDQETDLMGTLSTIINVIIGVVGFIAVVMIIIGGIGFVTSQGDAARVTKARNTILYGVVGLVVAILAYAIVNFVLKSLVNN